MIITIPKITRADAAILNEVFFLIRDAFQQVNSRRFAQERLLLKSPNGTVYAITVDDSGTVSAAAVSGNAFD